MIHIAGKAQFSLAFRPSQRRPKTLERCPQKGRIFIQERTLQEATAEGQAGSGWKAFMAILDRLRDLLVARQEEEGAAQDIEP